MTRYVSRKPSAMQTNTNLTSQTEFGGSAGADAGFLFGGGGLKTLYAHTHILSAKSEVPYDRVQGPLKGTGSSWGF